MTEVQTIPPVKREVRVSCDATTAFELFTAHIGSWWPLETHSVHGAKASVAFEEGRVVERLGTEAAVWGTVLDWDPPHGFSMSWHPGRGPEEATEVAVAFAPDADGVIVTLTHTGWERLAEGAEAREDYSVGWLPVLARYAELLTPNPQAAESDEAWFALQHRPGPAIGDGETIFAHPLFAEHVAFLNRLRDRGVLIAAGPTDPESGAGMTVVRVPAGDAADVEGWARDDDLSVKDGLFEVTVVPWQVRFTG